MVQHDSTHIHTPLTGSQAAALLRQGSLGAELVRRAESLTANARSEFSVPGNDQASGLRRAMAAPMRLIPPSDPSGDAA